MNPTDNRGVLLSYDRAAPKYDQTGILQEIVANRKHGNCDGGTDFLFATFTHEGIPWFIIGSSQVRTKKDIDLEKTPFKANLRKDGQPRMAEKGFAAKLPDFHYRGSTSIMYQMSGNVFSNDLANWRCTAWNSTNDLSSALHSDEDFNIHEFATRHQDVLKNENYKPWFHLPVIVKSALYSFLETSRFRSFHIYKNHEARVSDIDDHIKRLVSIYEGNNVTIYRSDNGASPQKVEISANISLGLLPKYWKGNILFFCKVGTSEAGFVDTKYKTYFDGTPWYGKLIANSKNTNSTLMLTADRQSNSWNDTESDFSITIAYLSDEYLSYENHRKESISIGQSDADMSRQIFTRVEGDLISDRPVLDQDIVISIRTALLKMSGKFRIIVDVLNESLKDNRDAGYIIEPFKRDSKLIQRKGIHTAIKPLLSVFSRIFHDNIVPIDAVDSIARHRKASRKRGDEGVKYDKEVCDELKDYFDNDTWITNDSHISSEYRLEGRGIDALGMNEFRYIAVQIKNTESLKKDGIEKFVDTVTELRTKIPSRFTVYPFLIWKPVKDTSNISLANYRLLESIGAKLLLSDMDVCEKISEVVG